MEIGNWKLEIQNGNKNGRKERTIPSDIKLVRSLLAGCIGLWELVGIGMDRTDELFGILRLHNVDPTQSLSSSSSSSATLQSGALRIAVKVAGILAENDTLVERMIKL